MAATTTKDRLTKAFGLKEEDRDSDVPSISNADPFIEREPTVTEFLQEIAPSVQSVGNYIYNLFPFIHWIGKYNVTWFIGDFIAGKFRYIPLTSEDSEIYRDGEDVENRPWKTLT